MEVVFGIYLGNSTSCVAVNKNGIVNVVANAGGDRVTPAVVAVHDDEVVTGLAAKQGLVRHGQRSVLGVLRDISAAEPHSSDASRGSCLPEWDEDRDVSYCVQTDSGPRTVQASNVIKHIFLQLKDVSSRHNSAVQCTACLCLPAWVSNKAVTVCKSAAREAGFKLVAVVLQPVAACLAYDLLADRTQSMLVMTLHLGESGGQGSLVEIGGGIATVRDSTHSKFPPGSAITNKLVEHLAKEFYAKYKGDCLDNKRSRQKLYNQAENVKHVLSTLPSATVNVDSLWEGMDFSCQVSRARFEGLIVSLLNDFLQPTLDMLSKLSVEPALINKVILSGGTCKIPRLQALVGEKFPNAEVLCSVSPDELLARGAAMEAAIVLTKHAKPTPSSLNGANATPAGKDSKNSKKKNRSVAEKSKPDVMRSHLPVLVSVLAVPVWCQIGDESTCVLPRLTPPLLRHTATVSISTPASGSLTLTLYEAPQSLPTPADDCILAQVEVPVTAECKELSMSLVLKPEGSLQVGILEPLSKKWQKFLITRSNGCDSS
ncbi:Heat shock protein 70 family [Trinorchestia longiramus]|nr:Heat shock protein 70 family [Trinorchestia longiramus]